ncbi:dihydrofolate reductase [Candidatus Saccharibacteria bacterium]|nr:dihydrofolate reductase [Candidatus Saccharibacteria bacterium]
MKVVLSASVSLNGMIAREDGQEDWLPKDGWDDFVSEVDTFQNFIMGRETYELVMKLYPDHNFDDVECGNKIIVTGNPDFQTPDGYTVVRSPEEALDIVRNLGIDTALVIGGGKLNSQFLSRELIDEVWLTYNPHILGKGRPVFVGNDLDLSLTLISSELRNLGRIHSKYSVNK